MISPHSHTLFFNLTLATSYLKAVKVCDIQCHSTHLNIGKVHSIEISKHLVDLRWVLEYGPSSLC